MRTLYMNFLTCIFPIRNEALRKHRLKGKLEENKHEIVLFALKYK